MIRKAIVILLMAGLLPVPAFANDGLPETSAEAAVLVHPASGRVLYAKNENRRMLIASTTKLMTALTAVKELDPEQTVEIKNEWTRVEGSSMYLRPGERYTVRELLEGLLLSSGNDAALALAGMVGTDAKDFTAKMNAAARELGLADTHFDNPHGLDSEGQYSTAADLAVLMDAVCGQPMLREIMGMRSAVIHGLTCENHNKLLRSCRGVFGGKTGFTRAAGRCLVSCCERDGMELICVTLSDPDDWRDHKALYDWAYGAYRQVCLEQFPQIAVIGGEAEAVDTIPENCAVLCLEKDAGYDVEYTLPPFLFAPVREGDAAGKMTVTAEGGLQTHFLLRCRSRVSAELGAKRTFREIVDRFIGICAV